jgi:hypothetical protein
LSVDARHSFGCNSHVVGLPTRLYNLRNDLAPVLRWGFSICGEPSC